MIGFSDEIIEILKFLGEKIGGILIEGNDILY